jgi:hypothetical protein
MGYPGESSAMAHGGAAGVAVPGMATAAMAPGTLIITDTTELTGAEVEAEVSWLRVATT